MRLLLDTHVFLWCALDHKSLGRKTRHIIREAESVFVSLASAWEFGIKKCLGKIDLDADFEEAIDDAGFSKLGVTFSHARAIGAMKGHRGDPFDRMLAAQAETENLILVTADRKLLQYPIETMDATE